MAVDGYMNLQLANSEEYVDGALAGHLGEILIRCNNVLYIRGYFDNKLRLKSDLSFFQVSTKRPKKVKVKNKIFHCSFLYLKPAKTILTRW